MAAVTLLSAPRAEPAAWPAPLCIGLAVLGHGAGDAAHVPPVFSATFLDVPGELGGPAVVLVTPPEPPEPPKSWRCASSRCANRY